MKKQICRLVLIVFISTAEAQKVVVFLKVHKENMILYVTTAL